MCLASHIGHVGFYHEVVEHGMRRLRHGQWQLYDKVSVGIGSSLAGIYLVAMAAIAQCALVVISAVTHPPEGRAAHYLIAYLGILHGHTGIAHCRTCYVERIACLVGGLVFVEIHMEGGSFILLYTYALGVVVHVDGKHACEA